ncbi:two-component sensor histidine kinase [Paenibacillus ferrarius]|uniref:Two-component sensor histidine kinase n=1 Tax=Paenibacillus ferrarius TaxID=1469647 RepID=A0A1V4HN72_9BACL|nr:sensor histidine kinase [Paenibacillus ferrarius]OPH58672.1 two-component sensor histidine kinase [Paenibacillus ferrarius]
MIFSFIQIFRKWLYNTKLRHKIMYSYLLLIMLPLGFYQFIASEKMSEIIINHVTYSAKQGFDQTYSFLNYRVQRIAETTNILVSNSTISDILMDNNVTQDINRELQDYSNLKKLLRSMQDSLDISRVILYVPSSFIFANETENFLPLGETSESPCFDRLKELHSKYLWCSAPELGQHASHDDSSLYVVRSILDPNNYSLPIGQLRVDVQAETIRSMLRKANVVRNSTTFLVDQNHQIVLASDQVHLTEMDLPETTADTVSTTWQTNNNYYLFRQLPSNWGMVTVIPLDEVVKQSHQLRNDLLVILLIVSATAYLLAYLFSFSVTRRITQLTSRLRDVQKGNLIALAQTQGKDEIGELIQTYNYMIEQISSMNKEQYRLGQEVKNAELKALQSQINPHFLYNTLDLINWMADSGLNTDIKKVVKALARFYKVSLSNGKDIITLREELQHVSFYVQIQNIRFENKINFQIDVPEELLNHPIPKITLQPLVENAILHGILGRAQREGTITIHGMPVDGTIRLLITDDGVGMSANQIEDMLAGISRSKIGGSSYGVKNVMERIRHYFGAPANLAFRSVPGTGTEVEITFPRVEEGE